MTHPTAFGARRVPVADAAIERRDVLLQRGGPLHRVYILGALDGVLPFQASVVSTNDARTPFRLNNIPARGSASSSNQSGRRGTTPCPATPETAASAPSSTQGRHPGGDDSTTQPVSTCRIDLWRCSALVPLVTLLAARSNRSSCLTNSTERLARLHAAPMYIVRSASTRVQASLCSTWRTPRRDP